MNPREWLGKQIREYHLTDIIGSGGMSAVFRGRHVKLHVERAVKVLRPDLANDPQFVRRFEQEARILAILEHPHLIRVFEFFEEKGFLFIVMEIASGESLDDLVLYHGVIPAKEMWQIVDQAAQGLYYAHSKGIVHRDLSPDNLMVAGYDELNINVKVIDFGIARQDAFHPESRKIMEIGQTTTNTFIGKLRYCSPEQAMEVPVDHRSDQYSLALIFLESITGKPAFSEGSPITALMRRVKEPPPRLSDLVPGSAWPSEVDKVLDRAMQSSPVERYPSILDFSKALGHALGIELTSPNAADKHLPSKNTAAIQSDDDVTIQADGPLIPDVISLAETMKTTPDLTIYPGSQGRKTEPRYGTIKAPPESRKFPWTRVTTLLMIIGVATAYLFMPASLLLTAKKGVESCISKSYDLVVSFFQKSTQSERSIAEKKATPSTKKPAAGKHQIDEGKEPFWMERPGVIAPVVHNAKPLQLPRHLIGHYETPVQVVVQCIILKTGKLGRFAILNSVDPDLDNLAMEAVQSWTYTNGTYHGRPADIIMDITVTFK
ncbi:protein kinase [bacterium]|nr:protein kinase [candidate division CSSED10-310 bacterium]